jgi:hypothetical protein
VKQAGQLHPTGIAPGGGFPCTVDAVLAYRIKLLEMAVGTAEHTQRVGNIGNNDLLCLGGKGIKHNAGAGLNATHFLHLPALILPFGAYSVNRQFLY